MARPAEIKIRVPRSVNFEYEELREFIDIVGNDNVSKEIRAMIRNFLENEKKGEAQLDPLHQVRGSTSFESLDHINTTLDIYALGQQNIRENIQKIEDVRTLARIEANGKTAYKVARQRKLERNSVERAKKELKITGI
jgi:hypothetical protein